MPIYDYDGTALHQIGKIYDNDGTADHQIGKVYDWDGTASSLIYSSEFNALAEGDWTKMGTTAYITSLTTDDVTVKPTAAGGYARVYKTIDVTNYSSITITCNLSGTYSYATCGLYADDPGNILSDAPIAGKHIRNTTGSSQSVSGTFTFDISDLSGTYYIVIGAYQGSTASPVANCTNFILE